MNTYQGGNNMPTDTALDLDARILYTTFEHARTVRDAIPGSRIVGYQRGYAIQLRRSGPYVLVSDVGKEN